jgi:adenylyltransferase/sulfurtransferase
MRFRELKLRRDRNCPVCGDHPTVTKLIDYQEFCGIRPPANQPAATDGVIEPTEVKAKLDRGDRFTLIDVREPYEYQIARIPGAKLIPLGDLPKRLNELDPRWSLTARAARGARRPSISSSKAVFTTCVT